MLRVPLEENGLSPARKALATLLIFGVLSALATAAPVRAGELEPNGHELAIFYGYLAPVNAFSALASE